jgi:nicotinate-nucleotide adenylyltransferase
LYGTKKHIGLFGGTFDPIHNAHLQVASEVRERFDLDTVYLIPAALPPHKASRMLADAGDRLEMIRRGISENSGLTVTDVELKRPGLSYTVDTVRYFKGIFPDNTALSFIVGIDAFLEIDTWKSYQTLFELVQFIVMSRPDSAPFGHDAGRKAIDDFIPARVSDAYRWISDKGCYVHDHNQPIHLTVVTPMAISSTVVRGRIRKGRAIDDLVPERVAAYIAAKGLYQ